MFNEESLYSKAAGAVIAPAEYGFSSLLYFFIEISGDSCYDIWWFVNIKSQHTVGKR